MAKVRCAVCRKEGDSTETNSIGLMYYCSNCELWVCYDCSGASAGFFGGSDAKCPNCGKTLKK
jgi:DNA polymerase III alpha subunit (gram-positive type)